MNRSLSLAGKSLNVPLNAEWSELFITHSYTAVTSQWRSVSDPPSNEAFNPPVKLLCRRAEQLPCVKVSIWITERQSDAE